jgi:2-polyprenyl-3-methyl-5-hydroxy-6-metoxy-1,4-benzoquinol methylase
MNIQILNAVSNEKTRARLAREHQIIDLQKTYGNGDEIKNINSGKMWDRLNLLTNINPKDFPMAWNRTNIVSNWIKDIGSKKILNIGPGPGNLEMAILENDSRYDWTGIDISKESVKRLKKRFPKGKFYVSDLLDFQTNLKEYDAIAALEVLEHISPKQILKTLRKISSMLKPNGYFICSIPLNEGLEDMLSSGLNPNGHVRIYTKEILNSELEISGLRPIKSCELYAYHSNYFLKSLISKLLRFRKPNNLIILSQKL